MGKRKSSARDIGEASPLASLVFEATIRPNIRTLFSDGKEDTFERPGDISGKRIRYKWLVPLRVYQFQDYPFGPGWVFISGPD
jgi:hypothetical protein